MKASRFSEEQIIAVLREHEAGAKTPELCRRHGISDATFYIYGRRLVSNSRCGLGIKCGREKRLLNCLQSRSAVCSQGRR